jgi:hypothetical protein
MKFPTLRRVLLGKIVTIGWWFAGFDDSVERSLAADPADVDYVVKVDTVQVFIDDFFAHGGLGRGELGGWGVVVFGWGVCLVGLLKVWKEFGFVVEKS